MFFYLSESNDTSNSSPSPNFPTITILPPIYKLLNSATPNLPKIEVTPPLCRTPLYKKNTKNSSSTSNIPDSIASSHCKQEDFCHIPNKADQNKEIFCIPRSRTMSQIKGTKDSTNQNLKMAAVASNSTTATTTTTNSDLIEVHPSFSISNVWNFQLVSDFRFSLYKC